MKLRVLGCSGGIGGPLLRTTSFLVDHDILIDAGTGVADLSIDELAAIDHVFLTHAHLDHIAALPLMLDSVADRRSKALTVYGSEAVLASLKQHIFNWVIWPDFAAIPNPVNPLLRYQPIALQQAVVLDGRRITALPAEHSIPAFGYWLDSGAGSLVFSGDSAPCDAFWLAVNQIDNLRHLIIECAFSDREAPLAQASKHFHPAALALALSRLGRQCAIHISHLKPGQAEQTMREIESCLAPFRPHKLANGNIFLF